MASVSSSATAFAGGGAQAGIQRRERFVQQHQPGLLRQGTRQRDPLLLPAGQLVRPQRGQTAIQRHHLHQRLDAPLFLTLAAFKAKTDVAGDGKVREQRAILRDEADAAQMRRHPAAAVAHGLPLQQDLAAVRNFKAGDDAQQGGFAGAGRADDRRAAAGGNLQVDVFQHPDGVIRFFDTVQFEACS